MQYEKLKITRVGTKNRNGVYVGWHMDENGLDNPAPLFDESNGTIGGYTPEELDAIIDGVPEAEKLIDKCLAEIAKHERAIKKLNKKVETLRFEEAVRLCPVKVGDVVEWECEVLDCEEWHPVKIKKLDWQWSALGAYVTYLTEDGKKHGRRRVCRYYLHISSLRREWRLPHAT